MAGKIMCEVEPTTYFTEPALLWFTSTLMGEAGSITHFTDAALPQLTGTAMCEVWANYIFHGESITIIGWR